MRSVLVSFLFFLGLMVILRTLLEAIPKWRARREMKKREEDNDR
ncbi:MAG: hypothetical protein RQ801_07390 [Spirochaetaceae bacterium]|nr:hypothetical protein [Spirochaetaceae bacterium]MDT8298105.1 hypothetical protein [Spirochaetaceae bacterium]